jgi:hypothetical protein
MLDLAVSPHVLIDQTLSPAPEKRWPQAMTFPAVCRRVSSLPFRHPSMRQPTLSMVHAILGLSARPSLFCGRADSQDRMDQILMVAARG